MASRGCGTRQAGGVYLSTGLSANGLPVDSFLLDPPVRIDPEMERRLQLSDVGVKLIKRPNAETFDVWDIVGYSNYPNVADMIQEIKKMGISRRIAANEEFAKLTPDSRLVMMHRRAWIDNYHDYYGVIANESGGLTCPRMSYTQLQVASRKEPHTTDPEDVSTSEMCLGTVYDDVEGGKTESIGDGKTDHRYVRRTIGDTEYVARRRPDGVTPVYGLAAFGRFPIGKIDVIVDKANGTHNERLALARKSSLPVDLESE